MSVYLYTICKKDIGTNLVVKYQGRSYWVNEAIGSILSIDIGKRVYWVNGIIQVENQEQLENRLRKEGI